MSKDASVLIKFPSGEVEFSAGDFTTLPAVPVSLRVPNSWQVVFYTEENFQGNSVVLSAHDGEKEFNIGDTCCQSPMSMRILKDVVVIPGHIRDAEALADGLHGDGWLQKSLSENADRVPWWLDVKFGCFVHWGIYAIAAGQWNGRSCGYAEHLQRAMKINREDYKKYFVDVFNPVEFNAEEWIKTALDAGMKYFVITAKHHDGFAMYHSDAYPFDMRMTPFKRDPMAELRDACAKYNMPFGMYYSHAFDWEHPDGPGNDWEYTNGGGDKKLFEGEKGLWFDQHPELLPRVAKHYVDEKSIPQIKELIIKYRPALLWFDTPHKLPPSENLRILRAIRETDPSVIVNGRLARNQTFRSLGDYINTSDRAAEIFPTPGLWETIPTTNESYGHSTKDRSHKPPEHFIRLLAKSAYRGGGVLMNLGPTALGTIEDVDLSILKGIGDWIKINGESIYGTSRSPLPVQTFGVTTLKGNKLYLHMINDLRGQKEIVLAGLMNYVNKAYFLHDTEKKPLKTARLNDFDTLIKLPGAVEPNSVIVVEFKGELFHGGGRLVSSDVSESLHVFDADYIHAELGHGDGKTNRDFVNNFRHSEQPVIWKVRTHKKTAYELALRYSTPRDFSGGKYSLSVGGKQYVRDIVPSDKPGTDTIRIEIEGKKDIVFRPVEIVKGQFISIFGLTLTPVGALEDSIYIDEDTTDTGDLG